VTVGERGCDDHCGLELDPVPLVVIHGERDH